MNSAIRRWCFWSVFFASGAPGLMAQMGWTRVLAAGLGHEFSAVMGVVSVYFVGMGCGAAAFSKWGMDVRRPERVYGGLELGCAVWILVTTPFLPDVWGRVQLWVGTEDSGWRAMCAAFLVPLVVVGPAAAALGATLPAMERAVAPLESDGRAVSALYAWNTAGAIVGVLVAVEVLMPSMGFQATLWVAAGIQVLCGCAGWFLGRGAVPERMVLSGRSHETVTTRGRGGDRSTAGSGGPSERNQDPGGCGPRRLLAVLFVTGFLGIGYELLGVRALAQTTENTVRTYAVAVASVLAGTVMGAAWNRRIQRGGWRWEDGGVLSFLALASVGGLWVLVGGGRWFGLSGEGSMGLAREALLALAVFLVPAAGMGWVFSRWTEEGVGRGIGVGTAVAWNGLGAACAGPVVLGLGLPVVGLKGSMILISAGYLMLVPWGYWGGRRWGIPLLLILGLGRLPSGLRLLELPPSATVLKAWDGRMASVVVVRTQDGERVLRVNNHFQQGGTATAAAARRHAHIPLLLHRDPKRVLFLGVGTGITMGAAVDHPGLAVEGVELLPEVVDALSYFEPENRGWLGREGFRVRVSDARRFVRATRSTYDVIVADLFHPAEDGAGMLYTREHFRALRERLAPGGLVCQWLPLHQLDLGSFRDVVATFQGVFPEATLWLLRFNADVPVVGLVGGHEALRMDVDWLARRMAVGSVNAALKPLALADPVRLLGSRLAGPASLRAWAVGGREATDDLPRVMFGAARWVYRKGEAPHDRLVALLAKVEPEWDGLSPEIVERLEAFRRARDRHLNGLAKEYSGKGQEAVEDYLASAGMSREYTAGYAQAVVVASAFARENPALARSILERLVVLRPDQGLAKEMLGRMER